MIMKHLICLAIGLVFGSISLAAQVPADEGENPTPIGAGSVYSLDQFGPVESMADAEKTFQKASQDIIAAGGGVLVVPMQTAPQWKARNNSQEIFRKPPAPASAKNWGSGIGITVVDSRGGTVKIQPPQTTGLQFNRVLDLPEGQSLPFWGYFPTITMRNVVLNGSCSYRDWLQEDVKAGKDQRFYVATIRGIFPGAFVTVETRGVPRLYVKSLGYDKEKKAWYFTADVDVDVKKGCVMGNKNHVNVLDMETYSHNENQTFDVRMWRHNYSQGDNYLFDARFKYMSDIHSTGGDENGVIYAAFVESDANIFRGVVDQWNAQTGELKYRPGAKADTLGSGRPIINLNPSKCIDSGAVYIVRPSTFTGDSSKRSNPVFHGNSYPTTIEPNSLGVRSLKMGGLIHFSADAAVTADVVGRYFAVNEEDEYVPKGNVVRRWYLIDSVTANPDGTKDIKIIRHWWGAKAAGAPLLYKPENYSSDGHEKPLKYIIAPGANAYDVSQGVESPQVVGYSKKIIKLVPTSFAGTAADFASGDPIEQAMGPDPFKPVPFRSWLWDNVPGAFAAPVFDVANYGAVMREFVMDIKGGTGSIEQDATTRYDRNPAWDKILAFHAACNTGITFAADTANAAIVFAQPNNRTQPIKWNYGGDADNPPKEATLTVSTDTGQLNFAGGSGVRFDGPVVATGLSADQKPSRNLRGKNVMVKPGQTTADIAFPVEEVDGDYAVFVEQNWIGNRAIVKKESRGFSVQFEKPAPDGATLDWMIVR